MAEVEFQSALDHGGPALAARGQAGPLRWVLPLLTALLGLFSIAVLDVLAVSAARPVAVIFPRTTDAQTAFVAIAAAGGRPIRRGRSRLMANPVWLAFGDTPDFSKRVRDAGALLVINPYAFGGCLVER